MKLVLYILLVILLSSCLGQKKVVQEKSNFTSIDQVAIKKDSNSAQVINQPISDQVSIPVPVVDTKNKEFDKEVNRKVDEILSKLNTTKKSGDNSYKLYYDLLNRQVQFEATIGETKNTTTNSNSQLIKNKSTVEELDKYVFKKVNQLPWYIWLIAAIILLNQILSFGQKLSNPLSAVLSFIKKIRG